MKNDERCAYGQTARSAFFRGVEPEAGGDLRPAPDKYVKRAGVQAGPEDVRAPVYSLGISFGLIWSFLPSPWLNFSCERCIFGLAGVFRVISITSPGASGFR